MPNVATRTRVGKTLYMAGTMARYAALGVLITIGFLSAFALDIILLQGLLFSILLILLFMATLSDVDRLPEPPIMGSVGAILLSALVAYFFLSPMLALVLTGIAVGSLLLHGIGRGFSYVGEALVHTEHMDPYGRSSTYTTGPGYSHSQAPDPSYSDSQTPPHPHNTYGKTFNNDSNQNTSHSHTPKPSSAHDVD